MPCLRAAAFVILGAMVGAAVEATTIVVERLCPGTSMKFCFCCSFVGTTLGPLVSLYAMPARRAAALVVRGTISGTAVVDGTARARKAGLSLGFSRLVVVVEGLVTDEGAYASEVVRCKLDRIDEAREPSGNWFATDGSLTSSGSSFVGNIGEDANRDAICTSAVWTSGEPIKPFCCRDLPYNARKEVGVFSRATAGSLSPIRVLNTSTARRRSKTYTQTGPLYWYLD